MSWAEQMGTYRFLDNEKVTERALIEEMASACSRNSQGSDLLLMADTCSYNLNSHSDRVKPGTGLGVIEDNESVGFYMHTCLVVDSSSNSLVGISDCQLWHREKDAPDKHNRKYGQLDISQKSSNRWIKGCQNSKAVLSQANSLTFVEDREGDIYEQFACIPDERTHLIIRSRENRRVAGEGKLYDVLKDAAILGYYELSLETDRRKNRRKGAVKLAVRAARVEIVKPANKKDEKLPQTIALTIVEAVECQNDKLQPLCWRLLTDIKVNDFAGALNIIHSYEQRWYIEELHRVIKKQGYNLEETQLEKGWSIRKLTVMLLRAAIRILQMWLAYDNEKGQNTNQVFSEEEIRMLKRYSHKLSKDKQPAINPYPPEKLTWATWLIGRLGGWKGYKKQHKPGPILLIRGYERFQFMYEGWLMATADI
jgi:hypothetical protein